jgi:hypothetical protein
LRAERIIVPLFGANQTVEEHYTPATLSGVQRTPEAPVIHRFSPTKPPRCDHQVGRMVDKVVLPAGIAGEDRQAKERVVALRACFILCREPQAWTVHLGGKGNDRATDTTYKRVHHWSQQRASTAACCSAKGEPAENFRFQHRSPKRLRQLLGKRGKRDRPVQRIR